MKMPPAIIFINNDISSISLDKIVSQLFIAEVMTETEFHDRLIADPNYANNIHMNGMRIIVTQNMLLDNLDQSIADIVMHVKNGLISIEKNNGGPPGLTLALANLEIHQLLRYNDSIYTNNITHTATPQYACCYSCPYFCIFRGCCIGGIFAIELMDISGVHCPNVDNELNNTDFINRK